MPELAVSLGRYDSPVLADVSDGEVVVLVRIDPKIPTRRRMAFRTGEAAPRTSVVEPGSVAFVHADAHGVVVAGTDVMLIDHQVTRRLEIEFHTEVSASRTMVAGAVSGGGREAICAIVRATAAVQTVELGDVEPRSLAVSDTRVAWVDPRDYSHVHLADPRDPSRRERVAVEQPNRVWFVGEDLYILHGSGGSRVTRWSSGALVTMARGISSLCTVLGSQAPMLLLPTGERTGGDRSRVVHPQRLVYLADPETVLYRGPQPDPARSLLDQPGIASVGTDGSHAVVVERHSRTDYRVVKIALPPAPRLLPANPPPPRPPTAQRSIMELELEPAYQTALEAVGIERLFEVAGHTRAELLNVPGLGAAGVAQIEEYLGDHDLSLKTR